MIRNLFKYTGIGEASAAAVMAALSAIPATMPYTVGVPGKILFFIFKWIFTILAALGLVMLNVGSAKIDTLISHGNFDGAFDDADKMIDAIRKTGRDLTPEEVKKIDDEVKVAFRKFAKLGKKKK